MLECSNQPDPQSKTGGEQFHHAIHTHNKLIDRHNHTLQQILSKLQTSQTNLQELVSMVYSIEQKLIALLPTAKVPSLPRQTEPTPLVNVISTALREPDIHLPKFFEGNLSHCGCFYNATLLSTVHY